MAYEKNCKCCGKDFYIFEINIFKATFTPNFSNFTCVDQFFFVDRFESTVVAVSNPHVVLRCFWLLLSFSFSAFCATSVDFFVCPD